MQVADGVIEVVQIDAAPVPVDELLMGGAIAGGTGDVGGEDGNALSEEMLVETRTGSGGAPEPLGRREWTAAPMRAFFRGEGRAGRGCGALLLPDK